MVANIVNCRCSYQRFGLFHGLLKYGWNIDALRLLGANQKLHWEFPIPYTETADNFPDKLDVFKFWLMKDEP